MGKKKKTPIHPHPKSDTMLVVRVPANEKEEIEFKLIESDLQSMQQLVGGYIERTLSSIVLPCGCNVAMVVNEEGLLQGLPPNDRATRLITPELRRALMTPRDQIVGDVFLIGEGPVANTERITTRDFFTMPPTQDVVKFINEEASHA